MRNNKSTCEKFFRCELCGQFIEAARITKKKPHVCGNNKSCYTCHKFVPEGHLCYVQKAWPKKPKKKKTTSSDIDHLLEDVLGDGDTSGDVVMMDEADVDMVDESDDDAMEVDDDDAMDTSELCTRYDPDTECECQSCIDSFFNDVMDDGELNELIECIDADVDCTLEEMVAETTNDDEDSQYYRKYLAFDFEADYSSKTHK